MEQNQNTRLVVSRPVIDLLVSKIEEKIGRKKDKNESKFFGFGKNYHPITGELRETTKSVASTMLQDERVVSFLDNIGTSTNRINFGKYLYDQYAAFKKPSPPLEILCESDFIIPFFIFVDPLLPENRTAKELIEKKYLLLESSKNEDEIPLTEDSKPPIHETFFYKCSYYSVLSYEPKFFGFSLNFIKNINGGINILAEEWGFHDISDTPPPIIELLAMDKDEEEGEFLTDTDFLNRRMNESPETPITEPQYSGKAEHINNYLYCNLKSLSSNEYMTFILCVDKGLKALQKQDVIRGGLLTQSSQGGVISGEVILKKVSSKEIVLPFDIKNVLIEDAENQKWTNLYLMLQRRLTRVQIERVTEPSKLRPKAIVLDQYISLLPGVYRVWNIGFRGQIVQSRIHITNNYKSYLIPFFTNEMPKEYKVQWCWLNLNKLYPKMVSLTSYVGMSMMNHAVIDFDNPVPGDEENEGENEDKIFVGVFSSAGHTNPKKKRKSWEKGGVTCGYMLLRKEDKRFKVREFNFTKKDKKSNKIIESIEEIEMFENYVKKHNLETFKKRFDTLIAAKHQAFTNFNLINNKDFSKIIWGV